VLGAQDLERGVLAQHGALARRWTVWMAGAAGSFLLWTGLMAVTMDFPTPAPLGLQIAVDTCFAIACASSCFFVVAGCLRFGAIRSRIFDTLAQNAFGIYVVHYAFVIWLQYALLGVALFALAKAMSVFGATLIFAWATIAAMRLMPFGSRLLGGERVVLASAPSPERLWRQNDDTRTGVEDCGRHTSRVRSAARPNTTCR
jgi:glucans biosynthesis protein C